MLKEIFALLQKRPFEPFAVRTSDGHEYSVPTSDHAFMNPARTRVTIFTDGDEVYHLSAMHVAGIRSPLSAVQD